MVGFPGTVSVLFGWLYKYNIGIHKELPAHWLAEGRA